MEVGRDRYIVTIPRREAGQRIIMCGLSREAGGW